jgi:hypothetical protein
MEIAVMLERAMIAGQGWAIEGEWDGTAAMLEEFVWSAGMQVGGAEWLEGEHHGRS